MSLAISSKPGAETVASLPPVTELEVSGMSCGNCARHVSDAIQSIPGVQTAQVRHETGRATVLWRPGATLDEDAILQAVRKAGFQPHVRPPAQTVLSVDGMTCQNCARHVAEALRAVPGVGGVEVDLAQGRASIRWAAGRDAEEGVLAAAVRAAGFAARTVEGQGAAGRTRWSPVAGWQFNVVVGSILTLPLMILEWGFGVGMARWYHWLSFALVLPIQLLCGYRFYRGAWNQAKVGGSNMDTLVVLGSTTAFAYSVWGLWSSSSGHLFFMEAASIITLISLGHWIESKISVRAARSLRALLDLAPRQARRLTPDGAETLVPLAQVKEGERLIIKPGDRIPIDGQVVDGGSVVNESMLTGESTPASKAAGSVVYGGTDNLQGWLVVQVTATGAATALAQIIAVVQRAQSSRANIQRLGDRVSSVFVPIVILVALATGLWWGLAPESARAVSGWVEAWLWHAHHPEGALASAIYHAAAVLIIACPCAMGLATPIAIMAGTNAAASRGILIRDGLALEKSGQITAVLFDKTGTLTQGRLELVKSADLRESSVQIPSLEQLASSLAGPSLHPLSQALAALKADRLPLAQWEEVKGAGVSARLPIGSSDATNSLLRLGSLDWLGESGVELNRAESFRNEWAGQAATVIGLAHDRQLIGLFALRDQIKPHAREVVEGLRSQGKAIYLVTGDHPATARAVARQASIPEDHVFAQVRPEAKSSLVKSLQDQGARVAFIGDGINDAPALEQADLGVAVARASDVAREAADIILLNSDIQAVPEALGLAQATLRTIRQNLFWAFFYNACGIPLAALGFLSPILCALAMGCSDLVVIGNALRLRQRSV